MPTGAPAGKPHRRDLNLAEQAVIDWNRQRIETQKQLAEKYRLENAITRGQLLDKVELRKAFTELADAILNSVMLSTELSREAREDIAKNLASWPLILEDVARGQSQLETQAEVGTQA
jgi:hypothetical protein